MSEGPLYNTDYVMLQNAMHVEEWWQTGVEGWGAGAAIGTSATPITLEAPTADAGDEPIDVRGVSGPHPGGNPGANLKSISHKYHPILVASVW